MSATSSMVGLGPGASSSSFLSRSLRCPAKVSAAKRPSSLSVNVTERVSEVRKIPLTDLQKTEAERAAYWARILVQREARGPGDMPNAMDRLERRYGLPSGLLWKLRYRRPKDIFASIYFRLESAYRAECERQLKKLEHEIAITAIVAGADHPSVLAASALVGLPLSGSA